MSYLAKPKFHHPKLPRNDLGLTRRDYEGSMSTLCAGCGHDSVSAAIVEACFELNLPAHKVAKMSGIGQALQRHRLTFYRKAMGLTLCMAGCRRSLLVRMWLIMN